jgi:AcrR family transcriptional regulator
VITAALELFSRHGVGGTSLQMIADQLGVTKAAVYHQFQTKEDIVLAAAQAELATLGAVVDRAEAEADGGRDALVTGMVDLAVGNRHTVGTILNDPVVNRYFADDETLASTMGRIRRVLVDGDSSPEANVQVVMLIAAISGAVTHPFASKFDDATLREQVLTLAKRFLDMPG